MNANTYDAIANRVAKAVEAHNDLQRRFEQAVKVTLDHIVTRLQTAPEVITVGLLDDEKEFVHELPKLNGHHDATVVYRVNFANAAGRAADNRTFEQLVTFGISQQGISAVIPGDNVLEVTGNGLNQHDMLAERIVNQLLRWTGDLEVANRPR
ncbi:hypothetical protein BCO18430_05643 [Burkholderia contaminans]|uniref:hypothetical protein n=1 Tax=Burkholderia contaminans TaxID=488447 RepID=UPI0014536F38|nr:hypothetical protein [Burkholderia contaminans]VWD25715.1 hypothetical protein BCO18430_05643 [Burkholderia contaminans]